MFFTDSNSVDFEYISGYWFTSSKLTASTFIKFGANTIKLLTLFLSILRSIIFFNTFSGIPVPLLTFDICWYADSGVIWGSTVEDESVAGLLWKNWGDVNSWARS